MDRFVITAVLYTYVTHKTAKDVWISSADGIYYYCDNLIVPHRRPTGGSLTARQITENNLFAFERSRVEHVRSGL